MVQHFPGESCEIRVIKNRGVFAMKIVFTQILIFCTLVILSTSCLNFTRQNPSESHTHSTYPQSTCPIDQALFDQMNEFCLREILEKVPLSKLLISVSPRDPTLQKVVRERVEQHWPTWFLNKIGRSGDPKRYGERLVIHYLAFLKMPQMLRDMDSMKRLVQSETIHRLRTGDSLLGSVGDHSVAFYDKISKKLSVYDTLEKKIVASGQVSWEGQPFDTGFAAFMEGSIEKLGDKTLVLRLSDQNHGEVSVWSWKDSTDPKRVHHQLTSAHTRYAYPDTLSVLRVSDEEFVTLTTHDASNLTLEAWKIGHKKRIKSVTIENCFNISGLDANQIKTCLEKIEKSGIRIESSIFADGPFGVGRNIDKKTVLAARDSHLVLRAKDPKQNSKDLSFFSPRQFGFHIENLNKNGDIIFRISQRVMFANIWNIVEKIVDEHQKVFACP